MENKPEKSKEQILAERQAKKATKQQVKKDPAAAPKSTETKKPQPALGSETKPPVQKSQSASVSQPKPASVSQPKPALVPQPKPEAASETSEVSKDKVHAEREAKKLAKQAKKKVGAEPATNDKPITTKAPAVAKIPAKQVVPKENVAPINPPAEIVVKMEQLKLVNDVTSEKVKQVPSKAERRAIQEAQRAMKAKALEDKKVVITKTATKVAPKSLPVSAAKTSTGSVSSLHKVKLFKHLYNEKCSLNLNVNNTLHPAMVKLGIQYANDTIVGSNSRCYAFLNAMKKVII